MSDKIPETVSVASRLPQDLVCQLWDMVETSEPQFGGGHKTVKVAKRRGQPVIIEGYNRDATGSRLHPIVNPGYRVTRKVSGAFWHEWLKQNVDSDIVRNNLVFAHADVEGFVRERESGQKDGMPVSGFEPLVMNRKPGEACPDPRIAKGRFGVTTADEQIAR
jgi:hypothetical protein